MLRSSDAKNAGSFSNQPNDSADFIWLLPEAAFISAVGVVRNSRIRVETMSSRSRTQALDPVRTLISLQLISLGCGFSKKRGRILLSS